MADVTLWGADYTDVPAIDLPQTSGGTVRFFYATDGDAIGYGAAPAVGTAYVGAAAICEEES